MVQYAQAEVLLTEVLSQLGEGVAILAADHAVVCWSSCAANLTGYSLVEINTVGFEQIFEPSQRLMQIIEQAKHGSPTRGERLDLRCPDGRRQPVEVWGMSLRCEDSATARILVVVRAVRNVETQGDSYYDRERLHLLAQLAGSVSHEIQNPLNAISLHTDILEEELDQPGGGNREQLLHSLGVVKARTGHLHALVQEYLTLARLAILPREPEDFGALLEALALEIRELLIPHGITLRLEGGVDLGAVALHKSTFWQALRKIVQYAIDAMPAGGTLSLRGQQVGSQIHLDISHPGRSCSEEQVDLLSNAVPTARPEEADLGVYLVREIVVAHQGDITVSYEPGVGTTFTVSLPLLLAENR